MSVVCERCGTANRNSAMFCIGCAGKLPGFNPSAPSALQSVRAELAADRSASGHRNGHRNGRRDAAGRELPAESPAFWLRLGGIMLLMCVAFLGWYAYVTRDNAPRAAPGQAVGSSASASPAAGSGKAVVDAPTATSEQARAGTASAPGMPPATAVSKSTPFRDPEVPGAASGTASAPATSPSSTSGKPAATPSVAASAPSASANATAAPAVPATRSPRSNSIAPEQAASRQATAAGVAGAPAAQDANASVASSSTSTPSDAAAIRAARREARAANARPLENNGDDAAAEAARRYIAANRAMPDLGPPVAQGPGPLVDRSNTPSNASQAPPSAPVVAPQRSRGQDLGPPVAPGPGPQYEGSRSGNGASLRDAGPPLAAGPGPLYDDADIRGAARGRTLVSGTAGNPFAGCANLDYLSMQSCRNAECQRSANANHPSCQALRRELTERDEARRKISRGD